MNTARVLSQFFHLSSSREQHFSTVHRSSLTLLYSIYNQYMINYFTGKCQYPESRHFSSALLLKHINETLNQKSYLLKNMEIKDWICLLRESIVAQPAIVGLQTHNYNTKTLFTFFLFVLVQQFKSTSHCIYWDAKVYCSYAFHV